MIRHGLRRFLSVLLAAVLLSCCSALAAARTNSRADYADLSDAEFANFRMVRTTGIAEGILFRSSSPIDPVLGRNSYADAELEKAGVRCVINLTNAASDTRSYAGYEQSAYARCNILFLDLSTDFSKPQNREGMVRMISFIAENEGPFLVHCTEGKNRAGFVCALLEALTGASLSEIMDDYMQTFVNYNRMVPGTDEYNDAFSKFRGSICRVCGTDDPSPQELSTSVRKYLIACGSDSAAIDRAAARLTGSL